MFWRWQAVAAIATIDLPNGDWRELMPELLQNVRSTDNLSLVQASLATLGYVCEAVYEAVRRRADALAHASRRADGLTPRPVFLAVSSTEPPLQYPDRPELLADHANNILAAVATGVAYPQSYVVCFSHWVYTCDTTRAERRLPRRSARSAGRSSSRRCKR